MLRGHHPRGTDKLGPRIWQRWFAISAHSAGAAAVSSGPPTPVRNRCVPTWRPKKGKKKRTTSAVAPAGVESCGMMLMARTPVPLQNYCPRIGPPEPYRTRHFPWVRSNVGDIYSKTIGCERQLSLGGEEQSARAGIARRHASTFEDPRSGRCCGIHLKSVLTPAPLLRPCKSLLTSAPTPTRAGDTTPNWSGI